MRIFRAFGLTMLITMLVALLFAPPTHGRERKERRQAAQERFDRPWTMSEMLGKPGGLNSIVPIRFAAHSKGLQLLFMANHGELSNPDTRPAGPPTPFHPLSQQINSELEYPAGSGTVFLFSGGLWVGAKKIVGQTEQKIVSTVTDGDNGTREYGPVSSWQYQSKDDIAKEVDDDGDWTTADDLNGDGLPSSDWDGPSADANGDGILNYDPEPHIDEDPIGDMSADYLDNDFDGKIDAADADLDGDKVPGSLDDDGDGENDEDGTARAGQEWYTAYEDTCANCLDSPDVDGFTPLGVRVVQHSYAWSESFADDFLIFEYFVTNIGNDNLKDVWLATFFDFDVGHITQEGNTRSEDDITFFIDSLQTAVGGDNDGDDGLLSAQYFGVRVLKAPRPNITISYLNFGRLGGGDPNDNLEKYDKMSSGVRDPDQLNDEDWRFLFSFGPLGDLAPGETLPVTLAIVNGFNLNLINVNSRQALAMFQADFRGPASPDAPRFEVEPLDRAVKIAWEANAENSLDPISKTKDFEGYRVWRTQNKLDYTLVADFDLVNGLGFDRGLPERNAQGKYEFIDRGLPALTQVFYVVTAYDNGDNGDGIGHPEFDRAKSNVGELESSRGSERQKAAIPNSATVNSLDEIYVAPNPYVGSSEFERAGRFDAAGNVSYPKVIQFVKLPARATIEIYTLAGNLVQTLEHTDGTGIELWNLRTRLNQEIVGGIYLYRVSTPEGNEKIGKFLVVK